MKPSFLNSSLEPRLPKCMNTRGKINVVTCCNCLVKTTAAENWANIKRISILQCSHRAAAWWGCTYALLFMLYHMAQQDWVRFGCLQVRGASLKKKDSEIALIPISIKSRPSRPLVHGWFEPIELVTVFENQYCSTCCQLYKVGQLWVIVNARYRYQMLNSLAKRSRRETEILLWIWIDTYTYRTALLYWTCFPKFCTYTCCELPCKTAAQQMQCVMFQVYVLHPNHCM